MSIDPRIVERRREVAEAHAKRNLGRLLRVLAWTAVLATCVWALFSPFLSVREVRTGGVVLSDTHRVLVSNRVMAGTPMILIRTSEVVEELETDPWVIEATVRREWPDEVVVRVVERVPGAWVMTSEGWARRAVDGLDVPGPSEPDDTLGRVLLPHLTDAEADGSVLVTGSVEFLANLPVEISKVTVITLVEDELWAEVGEQGVRLGRPIEMKEKALALATLLDGGVPPGAVVVLVAPSHPATAPVAPSGGVDASGEPSTSTSP